MFSFCCHCFPHFAIGFLFLFEKSFSLALLHGQKIPFLKFLSAYLFFSVPASLVEYIYLLKNKPRHIAWYGIISFTLMLILVSLPALFGLPVQYSLEGMVISSILRYAWLLWLLLKYSSWKISFTFLSEHLKLSIPLVVSAFLSGSAQYIDGFIVSSHFDESTFAIFRYGAREFPLVLLLANAFSVAMIPRFSEKEKTVDTLQEIKNYSKKLMHVLFPLSIVLLGVTHWLFPIVFNSEFKESATIFNIYLLLIVSRLMFPQTILTGLRKTTVIATASLIEIIINVALSLWFVILWGLPGIAFATVVAYLFEKLFLAIQLKNKSNISPGSYLNISIHLTYSLILLAVFYFVEYVIY